MEQNPTTTDRANRAITGPTPDQSIPALDLPEETNYLRSITRLAVGGIEVGLELFFERLRRWEAEVDSRLDEPSSHVQPPAQVMLDSAEETTGSNTVPDATVGSSAGKLSASSRALLRYALIGMIFDIQDRLAAEASVVTRASRFAARLASPVIRPVRTVASSRIFSPLTSRIERANRYGQREIERWIERGRQEDARSRTLIEVAFGKTVDEYIDYLTSNPEVQELVQMQSTGLANEVIEEVRERTVSADTLLEGLVRSVFRRKPRAHLPGPPPEIRVSAASIRRSKSDKKHHHESG